MSKHKNCVLNNFWLGFYIYQLFQEGAPHIIIECENCYCFINNPTKFSNIIKNPLFVRVEDVKTFNSKPIYYQQYHAFKECCSEFSKLEIF